MLKFCLFCVTFGVVVAYREVVYENGKTPEPFQPSCLNIGGICVAQGECPEGRLSEVPATCPHISDESFDCCFGLPVSETRCGRRGGECKPSHERCPDELVFNAASDCQVDEKCCILV